MKSLWKVICLSFVAVFAMALVGNGEATEAMIPDFEIKLEPNQISVGQPCPTSDTVTLKIFNRTASPITVDWSSDYIYHDPTCVSGYDPTSGSESVPASDSVEVPIYLSFAGDCLGKAEILFEASILGNPTDVDDELLIIWCTKKVPSLSTYGLIILILLLLVSGFYVIRRRRATA